MNYRDALARIYALQARGMRLGVSRMRELLALRGHPERGQAFVLVGGTNGKGSVSALLAGALQAAGYRTGLFTSPHLQRYVERVRVDGRPLGQAETARRLTELLATFERPGMPDATFFELTTLLALEAFRDHRCDVSVLEVGLGGRLDATNAVTPVLSVITRVALDHTQILGTTLPEIAREKAGIVKRGVPCVTAVHEPSALSVITRRARGLRAPLHVLGRDFTAQATSRGRTDVRVETTLYRDLACRLPGEHQRENLACAVAALHVLSKRGFRVRPAELRRALARVRWPGRLERIAGRPSFLLDAAHNLDGSQALVRYLSTEDRWRASARGRRVLVFGAMGDKDYPKMLRVLAPLFARVLYCPPSMTRAVTHRELAAVVPGARTRGVADALQQAKRAAGPRGEVVVTGSIFLLAETRKHLLGLRTDPLIRM